MFATMPEPDLQSFTYETAPLRVVFGAGALSGLGSELEGVGAKRAVIICGNHDQGVIDGVKGDLGAKIAKVLSASTMHVPIEVVKNALVEVEGVGADSLLAIGGGSSIGLAKAIARRIGLPIVAVPTTYSGSEMTSIWGETSSEVKTTGRDVGVRPKVVIYDPELTLTLPLARSVTSMFNGLAHAVEALYAPNATPISEAVSLDAIRLAVTALPRVAEQPLSLAARIPLLQASWLCGTVLDSTTMSLHHKICHVLGGAFQLPHAEMHTVVLPYVLAFNVPAVPRTHKNLSDLLGAHDPAAALWELSGRLGAPRSLKELGLAIDQVAIAAELVSNESFSNPRHLDRHSISGIIEAAFVGAVPQASL